MNYALKLKAFLDSKQMVVFDYLLAIIVIGYGAFTSNVLITSAGWLGLILAIYRPSAIADKIVSGVVKPKVN
ncbi:hypothetical protein LMH73_029185 [Vibrio splendidus]|nr:hypothetical protein [Vibrio splendidus]MCC4881503.1 hypothetical protein [Vibrio splendidus]